MPEAVTGSVLVEPARGLTPAGTTWTFQGLGLAITAPPSHVHAATPGHALAQAQKALDLGLASARPGPNNGLRQRLHRLLHPPVLPSTESAVLGNGLREAVLQTLAMMLKPLGWPTLGTAVAWAGFAAAGEHVLALLASLAFLVLLSLLVHELGHVAALRAFHPGAPALFTASAWRFRLVRGALPAIQDVGVTVAGPAGPAVVPLLLLPLYDLLPLQFWLSLVVALAHLWCLARSTGDGAALRHAMSGARSRGAQ